MSNNKVYIETYGCQMNLADTEVVMGILNNKGYELTKELDSADVVFLNTCSVRDNAEQRIHGRLGNIGTLKQKNPNMVIGVLGCMAERLRDDLIGDKKLWIWLLDLMNTVGFLNLLIPLFLVKKELE